DERQDRHTELFSMLHKSASLAEALGTRHAEVALQILLGVGAALVAKPYHCTTAKRTEPADKRLVIAISAIATEFDNALEQLVHVIHRTGTVWVARESHAVHSRHVGMRHLGRFFGHASSPVAPGAGASLTVVSV